MHIALAEDAALGSRFATGTIARRQTSNAATKVNQNV